MSADDGFQLDTRRQELRLACGHICRGFFSIFATLWRKTQSAVSNAVLRQVSPACRRKVAEHKPRQHSSVVSALSSCLELCLGFPQ